MRRSIILGLVLSALAAPVFAQSVPVQPVIRDKLPPQGFKDSPEIHIDPPMPALTDEQTAALLCQTSRVMGSTEGADYQPGVDAYGRSVAPADSGTQAFQMPDRVDIPVNIEILKSVGAVTAPTPDLTTNIGTVSVLKGGQVQFNGRDLTNNVTAYCAGKTVPVTPPPYLPAQPKINAAPKGQ